MSEQKKAVLMMHADQGQGQLWQTALATQQLEVIWEKDSIDLVQYLDTCDQRYLPDLLLVDMAIKSPNSQMLQSSSVCQWVNKNNVDTKIVLLNPRQEKIKDVEHSWALRRGASDVLPRLSSENLMTEIARVTALIGCSLDTLPLEKIVRAIAGSLPQTNLKKSDSLPSEIADVPNRSTTKNKPKPDTDDKGAVMYRGVRVRR
jgi:hypothetical protein